LKMKKINTRRDERINYLKTTLGFFTSASWNGIRVNFLISTGRTGTAFLAKFFRTFSPNIDSRHEPDPDLLKLGVNFARGKVSFEKAVRTITKSRQWICANLNKQKKDIYIESNNRLFSLIPALWEVFPAARIIHITRDGRDIVRSTMNRDHYTPKDGIYFRKNLRMQGIDFPGDPYREKWNTMTQFEKACWHWAKKDGILHNSIKNDPRAITIKFEDIFSKENNYPGLWEMIEFMDLGISKNVFSSKCKDLMDQRFNINKNETFPRWTEWDSKQRRQFMDIAGEHMKLYGYDLSDFIK